MSALSETDLDGLLKQLRNSKANGDPTKYLAFISVADAHAIAAQIDALRASIIHTVNSHDALITALKEAREYFAERADADQPHGYDHPVGNAEMTLLVEIDAALAKAGAA